MFIVGLSYEGAVPGSDAFSRRSWNVLLKAEWEEAAKYWGEEFRPKHFTPEGAAAYGYTKRKGENLAKGSKAYRRSYTGRKERQMGHTDPLVFTGESKRESSRYRIFATSKGARLSMPTRKLNYRHPKSQIRMADELRRVLPSEEQAIAQRMSVRLARRLRAINRKQSKKF
jgi:hypothetical protein